MTKKKNKSKVYNKEQLKEEAYSRLRSEVIKELPSKVDEFLSKGGVITQHEPSEYDHDDKIGHPRYWIVE